MNYSLTPKNDFHPGRINEIPICRERAKESRGKDAIETTVVRNRA